MTGAAKAFATVFLFRLLWPDLVSASIDAKESPVVREAKETLGFRGTNNPDVLLEWCCCLEGVTPVGHVV